METTAIIITSLGCIVGIIFNVYLHNLAKQNIKKSVVYTNQLRSKTNLKSSLDSAINNNYIVLRHGKINFERTYSFSITTHKNKSKTMDRSITNSILIYHNTNKSGTKVNSEKTALIREEFPENATYCY